jgi:hypothetical protein
VGFLTIWKDFVDGVRDPVFCSVIGIGQDFFEMGLRIGQGFGAACDTSERCEYESWGNMCMGVGYLHHVAFSSLRSSWNQASSGLPSSAVLTKVNLRREVTIVCSIVGSDCRWGDVVVICAYVLTQIIG